MKLSEVLKNVGLTDEQITEVETKMKENKIYTASEENLDIRYGKLKTDHDALVQKDTESQKLIAELQKSAKGDETLQTKIAEYEQTIKNQAEELQKTKIENALKVGLLESKATDIDYLTFKLKESNKEISLDDNGNVKGLDDMISGLKTQFPNQFETSAKTKDVDERKLETDDKKKGDGITKESFDKMTYKERLSLYNDNPDLYKELSN